MKLIGGIMILGEDYNGEKVGFLFGSVVSINGMYEDDYRKSNKLK